MNYIKGSQKDREEAREKRSREKHCIFQPVYYERIHIEDYRPGKKLNLACQVESQPMTKVTQSQTMCQMLETRNVELEMI